MGRFPEEIMKATGYRLVSMDERRRGWEWRFPRFSDDYKLDKLPWGRQTSTYVKYFDESPDKWKMDRRLTVCDNSAAGKSAYPIFISISRKHGT